MLRQVLNIFEELEKYRNLHRSAAIVLLIVSGGIGVRAFFFINELVLWGGISEQMGLLIVSMSWVLVFPVWILVFMIAMSVLHAFGFKDVRSAAMNNLSGLALAPDERHILGEALAARNWKHGDIFNGVVADLMKE